MSSNGRIDRLEEIIKKQNEEIIKLRKDLAKHRKNTNNQIGDVYGNIRSGKIKVDGTTLKKD